MICSCVFQGNEVIIDHMKKLILSILLCVLCSAAYAMFLNQVGTMTFGQADGENIFLNRIGPITYGYVGRKNVWLYDSTYGSTMTFGQIGSEPVWINNGNEWMSSFWDDSNSSLDDDSWMSTYDNDSDEWVNNTSSVDDDDDN